MFRRLGVCAGALFIWLGLGLAPRGAAAQHDHGQGGAGNAGHDATPPAAGAAAGATASPEASTEKSGVMDRLGGSEVSLAHYFGVLGFDKSADPTYNPTLSQLLSVDAAWRVNDMIKLRARASVDTELTNSDVTTRLRQPLFGDVTVGSSYKLSLPQKLSGSVSLGLGLPTSKESLARERLLQLAPTARVAREFDVGHGVKLSPSLVLGAQYWLARASSLTYDAPAIVTCEAERADCSAFGHSGVRSALSVFSEIVGVDASLPHDLSVGLNLIWIQTLLYPLDEAIDPTTGQPIPPSADGTRWRYIVGQVLSVDWQAAKHVKIGGGLQTVNLQQRPDGKSYPWFVNRNSQLYLTIAYAF